MDKITKLTLENEPAAAKFLNKFRQIEHSWENIDRFLSESKTSGRAGGLNMRTAQSGLIYGPPKGGGTLK